MDFNASSLDEKNTPWRWKRVAKWMKEQSESFDGIDSTYAAILDKAATYGADIETGVGNQPGVGGEPEPTRVTSVAIHEGDTLSLLVDDTQTLTVDISPADADDKRVMWVSDTPAVATVDAYTGEIKAVAAGSADITVTTHDGGSTDTIAITVTVS